MIARIVLVLLFLLASVPAWAVTATIGANTGNTYTGVDDTYIESNAAATNFSTNNPIYESKYAAGNHDYLLLKFTGLSNLVALAPMTVVSATLYIYQSYSGGDYALEIHRLLRNWTPAQVTWNEYSTGNSWTTAGALGAATDRIATPIFTTAVVPNVIQYIGFDVTADVQNIVDSVATYSPTFGWQILRADVGEDSAYKQFVPSESTDGQRPYLEVNYSTGAGPTTTIRHRVTQ